jgi:uncharacterized membrane protein YdjX (TVP38/TMEM64 family)
MGGGEKGIGDPMEGGNTESVRSRKKVLLFLLAVAVAFLLRDSGFQLQEEEFRTLLLQFGIAKGVLLFMGIYTLSIRPFVPVPPTFLTFVGGFTFAPILGLLPTILFTAVAATLNASLTLLLARRLGREFVRKLLEGKRLQEVDRRLGEEGFLAVLLVRLSPVGPPYDLVSYTAGVSSVGFWPHFFGTFLAILPGVFIWVNFGEKVAMLGGGVEPGEYFPILLAAFLLVAFVVVVPRAVRRWRGREKRSQNS